MEQLISTIKQRLECIKEANKELNSLTIKTALKSILYQLRKCKHKTAKILPFESHFGRKANTPLRNISTNPNFSDLNYEKFLNRYLDEETKTPSELVPEGHWGNYRAMKKLTCQQLANDDEPRFLRSTKIHRALPIKEPTVQLNLARNTQTNGPKRISTAYMRC